MTATNLNNLLATFGTQIQALEDSSWTLLLETYLAVAKGENLNRLGRIVGEDRQGRDDFEYRLAISVRILLNFCEGTPEQIIEIFSRLSNNAPLELTEYNPAALTLFVNKALNTILIPIYKNFLMLAKPAGVFAHLIYTTVPLDKYKKFDTVGQGFDSGKWTGVI